MKRLYKMLRNKMVLREYHRMGYFLDGKRAEKEVENGGRGFKNDDKNLNYGQLCKR